MIEMDRVNFKKSEIIDLLSKYTETDVKKVTAIIELLQKLQVISEGVWHHE